MATFLKELVKTAGITTEEMTQKRFERIGEVPPGRIEMHPPVADGCIV